jgi:hypothetical protein
MGISGAICCAARDTQKQKTLRIVVMLNWHALLVDLLHLDFLSMIGRISLPAITTGPI